jgi:hypothetical protein
VVLQTARERRMRGRGRAHLSPAANPAPQEHLRQSPYASGPLATRAISLIRSGRRSGVLPRQAIQQSDMRSAPLGADDRIATIAITWSRSTTWPPVVRRGTLTRRLVAVRVLGFVRRDRGRQPAAPSAAAQPCAGGSASETDASLSLRWLSVRRLVTGLTNGEVRRRSRCKNLSKSCLADQLAAVRGHEILPVGGHRNSPWVAANSPHGRPRISPPVLS